MAHAITRWIIGRPLRTHFSITSTSRGYNNLECTDSVGIDGFFLAIPGAPLLRGSTIISSLWLQKHNSDMNPISERRFSLFAASSNSLPR